VSHAINYQVLKHEAYKNLTCEIHINGQFAALLSNDDGFQLHPARDFSDASVTPEELQSAVDGAMAKLESADI
jgi:hypothetical protein